MQLLDRILFILAALSLAGIVAIFAVGEPPTPKRHSMAQATQAAAVSGAVVPLAGQADHEDMLVLSKEVDQLIEKYFENIRHHPEKGEEDARMVDVEDKLPPLSSKIISKEELADELVKKERRAGYTLFTHTVKSGESVWRIAQEYGVPVYTIISANPAKKKAPIHPGEELRVPDRAGVFYKASSGESLSAIANKFKIEVETIRAANGLQQAKLGRNTELFIPGAKPLPEITYATKKRFIMPLAGRFTSKYGWRTHPVYGHQSFHSGLDIAAAEGTPIRAAADGVVVFAGEGGSYGNMVILRHKDEYFTIYAHCSKLLVNEGDFVKQGKRIARVGSTGTATGAHLHFEVKRNKKLINPFAALKETIKIPLKNG